MDREISKKLCCIRDEKRMYTYIYIYKRMCVVIGGAGRVILRTLYKYYAVWSEKKNRFYNIPSIIINAFRLYEKSMFLVNNE